MSPPSAPPIAPARPFDITAHGDTRQDPWFWLRNREDPEVLAYLEAENEYTAAALAHTEAFQAELFNEIRGRIQETDVSAPVRFGPWDYFARTVEGHQYAIHGRRPPGAAAGEDETVLLDENALAGDSPYFALGGFAITPSHHLLAYATDFTGGERYTLRFRDLATGDDLPDVIEDVYYGLAWANDTTIFYVRPDEAVRPYQVWRHTLGTDPASDALVFEEEDERFFLSVGRTRSGHYLLITTDSKTTSEVLFIPTDTPDAAPTMVEPRTAGLEYAVEHHIGAAGDRFFLVTNVDGAQDFKVMVTDVVTPGRSSWTDVVAHQPGVRVHDIDAFADHLIVSSRVDGLEQLMVRRLHDDDDHVIAMPDPVYSVWAGENLDYETTTIRYGYTSLVRPSSAFDYDLATRESTLIKQTPVLGGYDSSHYTSARLWATAADGTKVPISVVHRTDTALDGTAPALLYGYGSYEIPIDPSFSSARLSLLDRGFVFAIAHIRGGGELGRRWYDDGKLMHKRNTFTDFIACAEHLVDAGYTSPARLGARGGARAGCSWARSPSCARTCSAPWSPRCRSSTWSPRWPTRPCRSRSPSGRSGATRSRTPTSYEYMKSYSPYDNVAAKEYPAFFVSAGLTTRGSRTGSRRSGSRSCGPRRRTTACSCSRPRWAPGHGGPSGRYDAWRDEATVLAFLVDQLTGTLQ